MKLCPICEKPDCLGHTPGEAARILVRQRTALRARVAELEAGLESCAESLELAMSRLGCPTEGNNGGAHGHDADDMGGIRALEDARDLLTRK